MRHLLTLLLAVALVVPAGGWGAGISSAAAAAPTDAAGGAEIGPDDAELLAQAETLWAMDAAARGSLIGEMGVELELDVAEQSGLAEALGGRDAAPPVSAQAAPAAHEEAQAPEVVDSSDPCEVEPPPERPADEVVAEWPVDSEGNPLPPPERPADEVVAEGCLTVTIPGNLRYTFSGGGASGTATIDLTMKPSPDGSCAGTAEARMTGSMKVLQTRCERAKWTEAIDLSGVVTSEDDHQVLVISTTGAAPRGRSRPMKCTTAGITVPSRTPLLSSSLFGEVRVRLADGEQAYLVTAAPGEVTGTVTVKLS